MVTCGLRARPDVIGRWEAERDSDNGVDHSEPPSRGPALSLSPPEIKGLLDLLDQLNRIDVTTIRARGAQIRENFTVQPLDPDEDVVFIGFKVLESMAKSLDELVEVRGSNRSALIREAISLMFKDAEVATSA